MIPGSVGAAPIQNIGAYGAEVKDFIEFVEVIDTQTLKTEILSNHSCQFGYRDSIFKRSGNRYIVLSVTFRLKKEGTFNLDYGTVREEFMKMPEQTLSSLRKTIINIRTSKLPNPEIHGNAGSFFKNPLVRKSVLNSLTNKYDNVPHFELGSDKIKIPAAWLIEKAGWKGKREGNVGTWPKQPLVLINYGNATGKEIFEFSESIWKSVKDKFGIDLQREVTVIGKNEN